jgi:hypothetical protein
MQCNRYTLGNSRCERDKGHDGKHLMTMRNWSRDGSVPYGEAVGTYEWTDAEVSEQIKKHGSRFD